MGLGSAPAAPPGMACEEGRWGGDHGVRRGSEGAGRCSSSSSGVRQRATRYGL